MVAADGGVAGAGIGGNGGVAGAGITIGAQVGGAMGPGMPGVGGGVVVVDGGAVVADRPGEGRRRVDRLRWVVRRAPVLSGWATAGGNAGSVVGDGGAGGTSVTPGGGVAGSRGVKRALR